MQSSLSSRPGHDGPRAGLPVRGDGARRVEPEILDGLDPASPAARASRRDLRRLNWLMGNEAWFRHVLPRHRRADEAVLEIGAGTGELGRSLRALAPRLAGLDLGPRPSGWPETARWYQTDVRAFAGWDEFPVVLGNLVLHHFDDAQLALLGARMRAARLIVASEPLRVNRTARLFSLLCPLIGAHAVTRHDGRVSIAAGFQGDELPRLLGLDPATWQWQVSAIWRGAYRLVAVKRT